MLTSDTRVFLSLVVLLESYLKFTSKIRYTISGSIITGVIEATLYFCKFETSKDFCASVKLFPVVDLIEI